MSSEMTKEIRPRTREWRGDWPRAATRVEHARKTQEKVSGLEGLSYRAGRGEKAHTDTHLRLGDCAAAGG